MKYYIDLDNTLCITNGSDYNNSIPIKERINYVNNLKENGNTIVIWTARGSASKINYEEMTKEQLKKWNVNYDCLLMGKPDYDVYIDDKSFNSNTFWSTLPSQNNENNYVKTKKTGVEIVKKGWGKEIIFVNNDEYCGKILCFENNKKFSMHYHLLKKETWYVAKGSFILKWIDTENGKMHSEYLKIGDVITNERGEPHQIMALEEDSQIYEVSSKHFDSDSYRIWKGD